MSIRTDLELPSRATVSSAGISARNADLASIALAVFVFALPFAHTVALRLSALGVAVLIVAADHGLRARLADLPLKLPLALWAALALVSLAWATNPAYSRREILNEIGYPVAAFAACYALAGSERGWRFVTVALVSGFLAISAVGLIWFLRGVDQITDAPHGGVGYYSSYLVTLLPLVMVVALAGAQRGLPASCLVALVPLLLLDGYGTGNRAFWPAALLAILAFAALHAARARSLRAKGKVLALTLAFAALAVTAFVVTVQQRAGALASEGVVELFFDDPRLSLWDRAAEMIEARPLTGGGFGRGVYGKELTGHFGSHILWHAHNLFLNYALQMGIGGVVVLVVLFGAIGHAFWRLYRADDPSTSLIGTAGLAMLVGVLAKNMTDDFFVRQNALLFWSIVGASLGYGRFRSRSALQDANRTAAARLGPDRPAG